MCCEPHVLLALSFYGGKVEFAILGLVLLRLFASRVFEEEDDTDRIELLQRLRIKRDQLFKLNILRAEGFDEVCEDALNMQY